MQPLWESVKRPNGGVDFGLSYHRTMYESQYDDFHDIFLQRWRLEDKPWRIVCVNRTDGTRREVSRGNFGGAHPGLDRVCYHCSEALRQLRIDRARRVSHGAEAAWRAYARLGRVRASPDSGSL